MSINRLLFDTFIKASECGMTRVSKKILTRFGYRLMRCRSIKHIGKLRKAMRKVALTQTIEVRHGKGCLLKLSDPFVQRAIKKSRLFPLEIENATAFDAKTRRGFDPGDDLFNRSRYIFRWPGKASLS